MDVPGGVADEAEDLPVRNIGRVFGGEGRVLGNGIEIADGGEVGGGLVDMGGEKIALDMICRGTGDVIAFWGGEVEGVIVKGRTAVGLGRIVCPGQVQRQERGVLGDKEIDIVLLRIPAGVSGVPVDEDVRVVQLIIQIVSDDGLLRGEVEKTT